MPPPPPPALRSSSIWLVSILAFSLSSISSSLALAAVLGGYPVILRVNRMRAAGGGRVPWTGAALRRLTYPGADRESVRPALMCARESAFFP
jgi:hypothetical protein